MTMTAPDTGRYAYSRQLVPLVYVCGLAAVLSACIQALFLFFIGPIYLEISQQGSMAFFVLGHGMLFGAVPVFLACFGIGCWALHLRLAFDRQINWPFWCIIGWAIIGVSSMGAATIVEAGMAGYKLSDMVFAPVLARIGMHALLMFALYSITLLAVGFVFVNSFERYLPSFERD
ncbi:MAG: hypothetical protein ACO3NE_06670 [Alphaproteobacteria bacterium]